MRWVTLLGLVWSSLCILQPGGAVLAVDVYGKRFDPPRIYFAHASINKNGTTSAIKDQVNFLDLYMPPIDNQSGKYTAEGFSYTVLLPGFIEIPDAEQQGLAVVDTLRDGQPWKQVTKPLDAEQVRIRSLQGAWGSDHEWIWFRISDNQPIPPAPLQIEVRLTFQGDTCFTDRSQLKIFDALQPPRLPPEYFKLWLHYGPRYRTGHWDEVADYMAKAGFNAIQSLESATFNRALQARGFYLIHQRSGSYQRVYENDFFDCLAMGPAWFGQVPGAERTAARLRTADATLLDFEPGPAGRITEFRNYPWLLTRFRKRNKLPVETELTEQTIREKYLQEWIEMRQELAAQVVRNWAAYCRSVNPKIDTILCQGTTSDLTSNIDYARYADQVTYVDPMNFTSARSLQEMKRWMARSPQARFTGCQNVSAGGYRNLFIADQDMMLQTLGAALIGCKGTSFYAGWALDAATFVQLNRVMTFLAEHQQTLFAGALDPGNLLITPIPKQDAEIRLGSGKIIRNRYPDWDQDAILRSYQRTDANSWLSVVCNRHRQEPCFVKLTAALPAGRWLLVDREHQEIFTRAGQAELSSADLAAGLYLKTPAYDYRGYSLEPAGNTPAPDFQKFRAIELEPLQQEALAYTESATSLPPDTVPGDLRMRFDDFNKDNQFEYLVESPDQQVWISPSGTLLKWKLAGTELRTREAGLCRDMLWQPTSERSNRELDTVMRLVDQRIHAKGIDLVFQRSVALHSLGGGVTLLMNKTYSFDHQPGRVHVRVEFLNDSLSMDVPSFDLSYRVHHYIDHQQRGQTVSWSYDGTRLLTSSDWKSSVVINRGLAPAEVLDAFTDYPALGTRALAHFGEFFPDQKLLLAFQVDRPERLLQLLTWRGENSQDPHGTAEWMYRATPLAQGQTATFGYTLRLYPEFTRFHAGSIATLQPASRNTTPDKHLLFHVDFEGGADARIARGLSGKATITGDIRYEQSPGGTALHLPPGATVSYLPQGNINLQRGKIHLRFKPLWHGGDGVTRYFLQLRVEPGLMYIGKLDDGRYLCNMFDVTGEQHWPHTSLRDMAPGDWHDATVTWDTSVGEIRLFLDGKPLAQSRQQPWKMGRVDNQNANCRLVFGGAPIVIESISIWDRPEG